MSDAAYCRMTGKIAYASKSEAQDVVRGMKSKKRKRRTDRLNVFQCIACRFFHIGNGNKKEK